MNSGKLLLLIGLAIAGHAEEGEKVRSKGRIKSWNERKGFGFIDPSGGGKQVFIHITAFSNRNRKPENNELVSYALSTDKQGRPCAVRVSRAVDWPSLCGRIDGKALAVIGAVLFLVMVGLLVAASQVPPVVLGLYLAASLIAFFMYAVDKSAAKRGTWRTPESTLHWASLLGGWPGALIAQHTLRHKSKKRSFRAVFWMTVFLNVVALTWLLTPAGLSTVQSWFGDGHSLFSPGARATIEWAEPR